MKLSEKRYRIANALGYVFDCTQMRQWAEGVYCGFISAYQMKALSQIIKLTIYHRIKPLDKLKQLAEAKALCFNPVPFLHDLLFSHPFAAPFRSSHTHASFTHYAFFTKFPSLHIPFIFTSSIQKNGLRKSQNITHGHHHIRQSRQGIPNTRMRGKRKWKKQRSSPRRFPFPLPHLSS